MTIKGFGNFDPGAYQHSTNNHQNRPGSSGGVSGRDAERDAERDSGATSGIASSARATFDRIRAMVPDPRAAIRRFLILRQLGTRMRAPETPVRSLEDARSRFLQQDPSEIADAIEILREAAQNGAVDEGTLHWMGQAAMELIQGQSPNFIADIQRLEREFGRELGLDNHQIVRLAAGRDRQQLLDRAPLIALGFTQAQLDRIEAQPGARFTFAALQEYTPDLLMQGRTLEDIARLATQNPGARVIAREARG